MIELPSRELDLGALDVGEPYRIAILSQPGTTEDATTEESAHDDRRVRDASDPPVAEGEVCDVEIEDVGDQVVGLARVAPGYIVFVPDPVVGDRVTVEITLAQENFAFAEVVEPEPIGGD